MELNEDNEHRAALMLDYLILFVLDDVDEMLPRGFKEQIYDCFQFLSPRFGKKKICIIIEFILFYLMLTLAFMLFFFQFFVLFCFVFFFA